MGDYIKNSFVGNIWFARGVAKIR